MSIARALAVIGLSAATILTNLSAAAAEVYNETNSVTVKSLLKGESVVKLVQDPNIKYVIFEGTSKGNLSEMISVSASGPAKITGKVEVRQITGKKRSSRPFFVEFKVGKKNKLSTILKDGSRSGAVVAAAVTPDPDQIKRIKDATGLSENLIAVLLTFMTEEQIIDQYGQGSGGGGNGGGNGGGGNGGGGGTTPSPGSLSGSAILHKDSCKAGVDKYLVRFVVDLSNVDPTLYEQGITVTGDIDVDGGVSAAASIKPVSDGKFAPQPLILVESSGYSFYGEPESLSVIPWKGGKPGKARALKINDYVYYRGYRLARSVATSALTGGSGNAEITNGTEVGNACINLVRSRQRVNGYPG